MLESHLDGGGGVGGAGQIAGMKRLLCKIGGHRWRTIQIEGETAYECRRCQARQYERGSSLKQATRDIRRSWWPLGVYVDSFHG
jgi:hypothetical protein